MANNPEMPELIPMDHNARINKERFLLIPKQALSRSARELGSGAFGVVYAVRIREGLAESNSPYFRAR